jgi:hypothetical protein
MAAYTRRKQNARASGRARRNAQLKRRRSAIAARSLELE